MKLKVGDKLFHKRNKRVHYVHLIDEDIDGEYEYYISEYETPPKNSHTYGSWYSVNKSGESFRYLCKSFYTEQEMRKLKLDEISKR